MRQRNPIHFLLVFLLVPFFLVLSLAACTTDGGLAPVDDRASRSNSSRSAHWHTVRKGDTLFSIAFAHGRDFRKLARTNRIRSPYIIYPGQRIQIYKGKKKTVSSQKKTRKTTNTGKSAKSTTNKRSGRSVSKPASKVVWKWPAKGKVIRKYTASAPRKKGIGIGGNRGQNIRSAATGKVVYSGDGLIGYGRLIIIKHNENYLSAYAHNQRVYVKEGQSVKRGEKIATMGENENNTPMLHFEIRKNGKPVNPIVYLPRG